MANNTAAKTFKALHVPGHPLVLTNVWDIISTRAIAELSSKAIATASYAVAIANGTTDDDLTLEQNISTVALIAPIANEAGKPLTVDIQDAYGSRLEGAITQLVDLGVAGVNLEDVDKAGNFYSKEDAVERIKRVLKTASDRGIADFVVNARCDVLVKGGQLDEALDRGKAYLAAGATTVFVWGGSKRGVSTAEVQEMVKEFNGHLNVSLKSGGLTVQELAQIGVSRISIGPTLQFAAIQAIKQDAQKLLDHAA